MKRRDLLKTGLAMAGAGTIALTGCSENKSSDTDILPKQTAQYEFSAPLPFNYKIIDEMAELNSTIKKSQIKMLYNNIPSPLVDGYNHWIHLTRGRENYSIKSLDDFGRYVKYALNKGFQFTYLMNSAKLFTNEELLTFKDDFLYTLDYLKKIGVKNIKTGSSQVVALINQYAPNEFNFQVSTCFDLRNISQYKNLFEMYPNFNFINIPRDENQNFTLFKSLKKIYPNIKIELMINEICVKGCPARMTCIQEPRFCRYDCEKLRKKVSSIYNCIRSGSIFPWDLEYYSAFGVNNYKYLARPQGRACFNELKYLKRFLKIIEDDYKQHTWKDMYDAGWITASVVNDKNKNIKLSEIAPLFPNIKHFIKCGVLCNTDCEISCNYCFECAKKLKKALYLV